MAESRSGGFWTRRRFLRTAVASLAGLAAAGVGAYELLVGQARPAGSGATPTPTPDISHHFRSRPDLPAPIISVRTATPAREAGLLFLTPASGGQGLGLLIADDGGQPVWLRPTPGRRATNLRASTYGGAPVLTWWEGQIANGLGDGEYVVLDSSYHEIARVRAGDGCKGDLHEFMLTPQGTALLTAGRTVRSGKDLIYDSVVQEVDVASGEVRFSWHSLDHVALEESYQPRPKQADQAWDFFHANSVDVAPDGDLIVSARHTWAIYKIDRSSGAVRWRLGGRKSDFTMAYGTAFSWQHDARWHPDGTLTVFDDDTPPAPSKGMRLRLDEGAMMAFLEEAYPHPSHISSSSQGNVELLAGGDLFVGWGNQPYFTEFTPDGTVVYDAGLPPTASSYRAFRFGWHGRPADQPAVVAGPGSAGGQLAYVSWNGATEVARWELLAGSGPDSLKVVALVPRAGFETVMAVPEGTQLVVVRALDAVGSVLGSSAPLALTA